MALKYDPTKYATVYYGETDIAFRQNGFPFDHKGDLLEHHLTDAQRRELESRKKESKRAQERSQGASAEGVEAADEKGGRKTRGRKSPEGREDEAGKAGRVLSDDIDLKAWASGQKKYPFFSVKKAVADRFHATVHDKASAITVLIDKGVIEARQ